MRGLKVGRMIAATIAVVMAAACSADAYFPSGPQVPEGFQLKPKQPCQVEFVRAGAISAERRIPACDTLIATPANRDDR